MVRHSGVQDDGAALCGEVGEDGEEASEDAILLLSKGRRRSGQS